MPLAPIVFVAACVLSQGSSKSGSSESVAAPECQSLAEGSSGRSFIQAADTRRISEHVTVEDLRSSHKTKRVKSMMRSTWSTNAGQDYSKCIGSLFQTDFSGNANGLAVQNGIRIVKASCPMAMLEVAPATSKKLTCSPNATGCHAWCAPVHISAADKSNFTRMHEKCLEWDTDHTLDIARTDPACGTLSTVVTWARTEVPINAAALEMRFATATQCDNWCSPLWVTLYDAADWSKFWRWCANARGEWGDCDVKEELATGSWRDLAIGTENFTMKHGYAAPLLLELAVYNDGGQAVTMIDSLNYVDTVEGLLREPALLQAKTGSAEDDYSKSHTKFFESKAARRNANCGALAQCPTGKHCCRNHLEPHKARCCPETFVCCGEECCPEFGACSVDTHTGEGKCALPMGGAATPPALCAT